MLKTISKVAMTSTLVLGLCATGASASNIMFVMDASGSMKKDAGNGFSRMENAQAAIARMLTDVDDSNRYGLTVYGHRKAKECSDIQVVAEVGSVNAGFVNEFVQQLEPIGETPIAESVRMAAASLESYSDENNQLVVVTDGIEECGGDVCAVARDIADSGIGLQVNVVGFTLSQEQQSLVRCLADKTGGKFYDAQDSDALEAAFTQVRADIVVAEAKPAPMPAPQAGVWFEDNFDGDSLSEAWSVDNDNGNYAVEDGKLLVVFPDKGETDTALAKANNVFRLNKDMPKGDWTMSARFEFGAQTHGEWLRMGVSEQAETSLLASYQNYAYNYSWTQMFVRVDKDEQDKNSNFFQKVGDIGEEGDIAKRSQNYAAQITGIEMRMEKRGRGYTVFGKLEGEQVDGKWAELQKMTSIKSPGEALTLAFGNDTNGYVPRNGEGLVQVDWVRVTTP